MIATGSAGFELRPTFEDDFQAQSVFLRCVAVIVRGMRRGLLDEDLPQIRQTVMHYIARRRPVAEASVRLAVSVLCDLVAQGWQVTYEQGRIRLHRPLPSDSVDEERTRVRRTLSLAKQEQLRTPQVRAFVQEMETMRYGPVGWCSVRSLVRDGNELASQFAAVASQRQIGSLEPESGPIQPYIQFVRNDEVCAFTGLKLTDVWRYFRYTWLTASRSTPGRTMQVLIRDAAVEPHPIIGIAALSSSIVQQTERDEWIGWTGDKVLDRLQQNPTDTHAKWLSRSLDDALDGIYVRDFIRERVIGSEDLAMPSQLAIDNLLEREIEYRNLHKITARAALGRGSTDWSEQATTSLFKSKRAGALAQVLQISQDFKECGFWAPTGEALASALLHPQFRHAVRKLVRLVKASKVGISMMDISVAGAIAPYNEILGGKLVSMLLTSAEVREEYHSRYGQSPSIIASSMKGQSVLRKPELVLLCTTGLFGHGSVQYNRVSMPYGDNASVKFKKLDSTTQFGTFHFSDATIHEMKRFAEIEFEGNDVRGIFGEGVNPKMRKIRQSLDRLGFPSSHLLRHSTPRSVYVIPLASNFREYLLGIDDKPSYISNLISKDDTRAIVAHWMNRWLKRRLQTHDVEAVLRKHTIDDPSHRAFVQLPDVGDEDQGLLGGFNFDEVEERW